MKKEKTVENSEAEIFHKKIGQKMRLLLANPDFRKDIRLLRKKFIDLHTGAIEAQRLMDDYVDFGKYDSVMEGKFLAKISANSKAKKENKEIEVDILSLVQKYKLRPRDYWEGQIESIILSCTFSPVAIHCRLYSLGSKADLFIDPGTALDQQNFAIWADEKHGLSLQIFNDTSLDDIKKGWHYIERARTFYYGKKKFYPLKNLDVAKKIFNLDTTIGKSKRGSSDAYEKSDLKKQDLVFGETNDFKKEDRGIQKIKRIRHRYSKKIQA